MNGLLRPNSIMVVYMDPLGNISELSVAGTAVHCYCRSKLQKLHNLAASLVFKSVEAIKHFSGKTKWILTAPDA